MQTTMLIRRVDLQRVEEKLNELCLGENFAQRPEDQVGDRRGAAHCGLS